MLQDHDLKLFIDSKESLDFGVMPLFQKFKSLLHSAETERPFLGWLKKHPHVLTQTIPFARYITSEFPFGSDYRADFVALAPFSGGCEIYFIEMEPPNVPLFTKKGNPARRLAAAISQIDCWRQFIQEERQCVLRELSKFFQKRELIFNDRLKPSDNAGRPLYHKEIWIRWEYVIVIGRRAKLTAEDLKRKASFLTNHHIDVMTYDRLLEAAKNSDEAP